MGGRSTLGEATSSSELALGVVRWVYSARGYLRATTWIGGESGVRVSSSATASLALYSMLSVYARAIGASYISKPLGKACSGALVETSYESIGESHSRSTSGSPTTRGFLHRSITTRPSLPATQSDRSCYLPLRATARALRRYPQDPPSHPARDAPQYPTAAHRHTEPASFPLPT